MSIIDDLKRLGIYSEKLERRIDPDRILNIEVGTEDTDSLEYEIINSESGQFKLFKVDFSPEHLHGSLPLSSILDANTFELNDFNRILFIDCETTGLGGAGTVVFVIGVLYFDGSRFMLEQLMMRDFEDEIAMLEYFRALFNRFNVIISFNGKCFDVPVIVDRYLYNRIIPPEYEHIEHIDLLNFSRMLWAGLIENCKLKTIERELLGFARYNDIEGWQIPNIYHDYLRNGNENMLKEVILHNRYDLLSLVSLFSKVSRSLNSPRETDFSGFQRYLKVGRYYERKRNYGKCIDFYSCAFDTASNIYEKLQSTRRCSLILKRTGEDDESLKYLKRAIEFGCEDAYLLQEISKYYEHKKKNYFLAKEFAVRALRALDKLNEEKRVRVHADFVKRVSRIDRKVNKIIKIGG